MSTTDDRGAATTTPLDPKALIRGAYAVASENYRGGDYQLAAVSGYAHWLRRLGSYVASGSRVLDLGCGIGVPVARELAKRHRVVGVDLSETQLTRARSLVPDVEFVCADMTEVHFEPGSFDAVTAFFSLINVPASQQAPLIHRVSSWLVPGGIFLAIVGKVGGTWVEENWRGVKGISMYYSHAGLEVSRASVREAGFEIIEEGTEPEGGMPGFAVMIARKQGNRDAL